MSSTTASIKELLAQCTGFEWDEGNRKKNWFKHRVTTREAEEAFFNTPALFAKDHKHSQTETRYACYGRTGGGRKLFISFTFRGDKIRVISARDQNRKEKEVYEQKTQKAA